MGDGVTVTEGVCEGFGVVDEVGALVAVALGVGVEVAEGFGVAEGADVEVADATGDGVTDGLVLRCGVGLRFEFGLVDLFGITEEILTPLLHTNLLPWRTHVYLKFLITIVCLNFLQFNPGFTLVAAVDSIILKEIDKDTTRITARAFRTALYYLNKFFFQDLIRNIRAISGRNYQNVTFIRT